MSKSQTWRLVFYYYRQVMKYSISITCIFELFKLGFILVWWNQPLTLVLLQTLGMEFIHIIFSLGTAGGFFMFHRYQKNEYYFFTNKQINLLGLIGTVSLFNGAVFIILNTLT